MVDLYSLSIIGKIDAEFMQKNAQFFKKFDKKKKLVKVKESALLENIINSSYSIERKTPIHLFVKNKINAALIERKMFRKDKKIDSIFLSAQEKLKLI
jgi:hypothetical protein